jgi:hypothetical protein
MGKVALSLTCSKLHDDANELWGEEHLLELNDVGVA